MSVDTLRIIVEGEDRASGVLGTVGGRLAAFGARATRTGMDLLPLSAAAGAVTVSALHLAAGYEQSMDVLQTTSKATAADMALLGARAIELGADITLPGTSAKDAADAMLELSKAGLSVTDTMDAAQGVLQMSAAAQIGNAQAAEITANALNMFHLAGKDAAMVADLLAAGANASSAGVTDMADALQMAGAVAAMAGVNIQDTTTAIALMANQGIKGSDAGTSFKQMLLSLQAPSSTAKKAMNALGISVYDAAGNMLPMPGLIQEFEGALVGLTQKQRNAALATIFGSDAVRAANILLMGGTEAWQEMAGAVTAGGAAAELAAAQNKGLNGALDGFRSVIETALLSGAQPLLETLSGLVRTASELVGGLAEANPQIVTAGIAFGGVLAVAAPLALGIGVIATSLGALAAPIGLVVLAAGALAAAWATDFGGIRETTASVVGEIGALLGPVIAWVQTELPGAVQNLVSIWGPAWQQVKMLVEGAFIAIRDVVTRVLGIVVGSVQEHAGNLQALFVNAWFRVRDIVVGVLDGIRQIVMTVLAQVQIFLATHGEEIKQVLGDAWEQIGRIINLALDVIRATVVPLLEGIARFIREHSAEIQTLLNGAWTLIKTTITTVLGVIEGIIKAVLAAVKGDWKGAWEEVKKVADTLWSGIKKIIETALNTILGLVKTNLEEIKQWFVDKFNEIKAFISSIDLAEMGRNLIQGLINGIASKFGDAIAEAKRIIGGIKNAILGGLEEHSPSQFGVRAGAWLGQGLALGIEESQPLSLGALGTHVAAIVTELARLANSVISPAAIASAKAVTDPLKTILENVAGIVEGVNTLASVRTPVSIGAQLQAVSDAVSAIVYHYQYMADVVVAAPAVWSAKAFSGPVAEIFENLQTIVEGTTALGGLAVDGAGDMPARIGLLGTVVEMITHELSAVAARLPDLGAAAAVLALEVAPVLGIVEPALSALDALLMDGFKTETAGRVWLQVGLAKSQIRGLGIFVRELAEGLGAVARELRSDLLDAARELSENLGPVLNVVNPALAAVRALGEALVVTPTRANVDALAQFVRMVVDSLGRASALVAGELQTAAKELASRAEPVFRVLSSAIDMMGKMGRVDLEMLPAANNALDHLAGFIGGIVARLGGLRQKLGATVLADAQWLAETGAAVFALLSETIASMGATAALDAASLYEWAFDAGWNWVTGLRDGIASGMTALQGVLGQVSGALAGPLSSPMVAPGGNSAAQKTAINNTFNIYNPVIRDEQDIAALADAVSERIGTRALVYTRMGA